MLAVGIGCKRDTSRELIEDAVKLAFADYKISEKDIVSIATSETKASEIGLLQFCSDRSLPLILFPSDILATVSVPNPSSIVNEKVKTASVAEAAALLALTRVISNNAGAKDSLSLQWNQDNNIYKPNSYLYKVNKHFIDSTKTKLLTSRLLIPKQIYQNTVTIAVASIYAPEEYNLSY
jgi:hypothetical protein